MIITRLRIFDPNNIQIQDIPIKETGISIIYGDIEKKDDRKQSSNSLGKTTLMKLLDYILRGVQNDNDIIKSTLNDFYIIANVIYRTKEYEIKRVLNRKTDIYIDDKYNTLEEYKKFFNLDTDLLSKLVSIYPRVDLFSNHKGSNKEELVRISKLLNLDEIATEANKIHTIQSEIKELKTQLKRLAEELRINEKEIASALYITTNEIKQVENQINSIKINLGKLDNNYVNEQIQKEYSELNQLSKILRNERNFLDMERTRYLNYLENDKKSTVTAKDVFKIYNKAKVEVPEMVKHKYEEVLEFYNKISIDRKTQILSALEEIEPKIKTLQEKLDDYKFKMDKISVVLSENEAYSNAMKSMSMYNDKLNELSFKMGQMNQLNETNKKIEIERRKLVKSYGNISDAKFKYNELINNYEMFMFELAHRIYGTKDLITFKIDVRKNSETLNPITIDFSNKRSGAIGGFKESTYVMFDILLYKYNQVCNFLLLDSTAFDRIDYRQVNELIIYINELSQKINKQAIISINKYQIQQTPEMMKLIDANKIITFNENKWLFDKMSF